MHDATPVTRARRLIPLIAVQPRFSTVRCKVLSSSPLPWYPSASSMLVRPFVLQDPPRHPLPSQLPLNHSSRSVSSLDSALTQVLILRHLKSFRMNTYTKPRGRVPLQASQFVNSLLPLTTPKPTISATVTSPANPSLSTNCGHFPSPIGVGGRTAAISSSSTSTLDPQRLPAARVASIARNARLQVLCLPLLQTPPSAKSFPCHSYENTRGGVPPANQSRFDHFLRLSTLTLNLSLPLLAGPEQKSPLSSAAGLRCLQLACVDAFSEPQNTDQRPRPTKHGSFATFPKPLAIVHRLSKRGGFAHEFQTFTGHRHFRHRAVRAQRLACSYRGSRGSGDSRTASLAGAPGLASHARASRYAIDACGSGRTSYARSARLSGHACLAGSSSHTCGPGYPRTAGFPGFRPGLVSASLHEHQLRSP